MSDKKKSEKKALQESIRVKMIELILSLDPTMKEKKVLRRAKQAARIIGRGVKPRGTELVAEVLEIRSEDPEMTSQL